MYDNYQITYHTDIETPSGALRQGVVVGVDYNENTISVRLRNTPNMISNDIVVTVKMPYAFLSSSGMFVGSVPSKDTNVFLTRSEGGEWCFVSFYSDQNTNLPTISENELLIQSSEDCKITLDNRNNIKIGSDYANLQINGKSSTINTVFDRQVKQTLASRSVDGVVQRDTNIASLYDNSVEFADDSFKYEIGLDPLTAVSYATGSSIKNPAFVENRSVVFEFAQNYTIRDDLNESKVYKKDSDRLKDQLPVIFGRSNSSSDILNLNPSEPNFLIESVSGTVIDIFGNILDLNRSVIPIGKEKSSSLKKSEDPSRAFLKIREAERKSIAFHFEINSRKPKLPDLYSKDDFARSRSRFFVDIDKEGQFKINVPASSETGNVPVLTRYENFSRLKAPEGKKLPENTDVLHDSFSILNQVKLMEEDRQASPIDRIELAKNSADDVSKNYITLGTPYHNVLKSCFAFQEKSARELIRQSQTNTGPNNSEIHPTIQHLMDIEPIKNIVQPTIQVSGKNANAGGRSGAINLDGFFSLSVGANTSDKQSAWIDMQGGIIANFGRDKNNISAAVSMDGDLIVQIGQNPEDPEDNESVVTVDSRFGKQSFRGGSLDIRVLNEGNSATFVRIDKHGVTVLTPGIMTLKGSEINLVADGNVTISGETAFINDTPFYRYKID